MTRRSEDHPHITLALLVATLILFIASSLLAFAIPGWRVYMIVACINTVLGVLIFTPLHEACHRIAHKNQVLNEACMLAVWPLFLHSPYFFRHIHNLHHVHTGDPQLDPDAFTKSQTRIGQWIRSFLLLGSYYRRSLSDRRFMPLLLSSTVLPVVAVVYSVSGRYGTEVFFTLLLPNILATGILGFINTAWPHGIVGSANSRIENTMNIRVPKWLELLMGYQNYHLVHHLRPNIPWYKYRSYWRRHQTRLENLGARTLNEPSQERLI